MILFEHNENRRTILVIILDQLNGMLPAMAANLDPTVPETHL